MSTMKEVLVLDIDREETHAYRFTVQGESVQAVYRQSIATSLTRPRAFIHIVEMLLVSTLHADSNPVDVAIITSYGDAYIHMSDAGHEHVYSAPRRSKAYPQETASGYAVHGTPADLPRLAIRELMAHHGHQWDKMLPISRYVSLALVQQAGNGLWDDMHASHTGRYNLQKRHPLESGPQTLHPGSAIGVFEQVPFIAGGRHSAFYDFHSEIAYVDTDADWTAGRIFPAFTADLATQANYDRCVRWSLTAYGRAHAERTFMPQNDSKFTVEDAVNGLQQLLEGAEQPTVMVFGKESATLYAQLLSSSSVTVTPGSDITDALLAPDDWGFPFWVARRGDGYRASRAALFAAKYC